jgi:hypothetical protein
MNGEETIRSRNCGQMNVLMSHQMGDLLTMFPSHMTELVKHTKFDNETQKM